MAEPPRAIHPEVKRGNHHIRLGDVKVPKWLPRQTSTSALCLGTETATWCQSNRFSFALSIQIALLEMSLSKAEVLTRINAPIFVQPGPGQGGVIRSRVCGDP